MEMKGGLLGEFEATLDVKGRFLLPAGFKKQLPGEGGQFVINRGMEGCLSLYPMPAWEPLMEKITNLDDFDPKVRQFKRLFLNGATVVELDSAGRILIPPTLKDRAGIIKELVLCSAGNKIEVWAKDRYEQFLESTTAEEFSDLAKDVMVKKGLDS